MAVHVTSEPTTHYSFLYKLHFFSNCHFYTRVQRHYMLNGRPKLTVQCGQAASSSFFLRSYFSYDRQFRQPSIQCLQHPATVLLATTSGPLAYTSVTTLNYAFPLYRVTAPRFYLTHTFQTTHSRDHSGLAHSCLRWLLTMTPPSAIDGS